MEAQDSRLKLLLYIFCATICMLRYLRVENFVYYEYIEDESVTKSLSDNGMKIGLTVCSFIRSFWSRFLFLSHKYKTLDIAQGVYNKINVI